MIRTLTAALLALLAAPATAHAVGEEEWQLSGRIGFGGLHIDKRSPMGVAMGVELEYGLSDAWAGRLSLGHCMNSVEARAEDHAPGGFAMATSLLGGLTYTFDVLRMVPYTQLSVGFVRFDGAVIEPRFTLAGELSVGFDYWLSRRWATGAALQYLFAPLDLFEHLSELGQSPFSYSLTWRISRLF